MRPTQWILVLALCAPARLHAHGGTSHSGDMAVDNQLSIGRDAIRLTQVHTCAGKLAEDLWGVTDSDGDGTLSDAEWARGIEDSRTVFQQWCRLEVDWKTVLPAQVDVRLASFPRTRPATFAGASQLVLEHHARYPTADAGPVRNVGLNVTSLNARTIRTRVRCDAGMKVETTSFGTLEKGGAEVSGMVQQDGLPDQIALVVREHAAGGTPGRGDPVPAAVLGCLAAGVGLLVIGLWALVSRAVAYGRASALGAPPSAWPIVASFVVMGAGACTLLHGLVSGGFVILKF